MTLFAHLIIVDSEAEAAMTLGRTYLTRETRPRPRCGRGRDLVVK
jgi:Xaa-Pro dipeptidase